MASQPDRALMRSRLIELAYSRVAFESRTADAETHPYIAAQKALLFAVAAHHKMDDVLLSKAIEAANLAIENSSNLRSLSLHGGWCGLAWILQQVSAIQKRLTGCGGELDEDLLEALVLSADPQHYDLISGLVGRAVCFLAFVERDDIRRALLRTLGTLQRRAERSSNTSSWATPPEQLTPKQRRLAPAGYYNLGLAHGATGVLALCASAAQYLSPDEFDLEGLAEPVVNWILDHENASSNIARFDNWVGGTSSGAKAGWCYGELSIGITLLRAGLIFGQDRWVSKGRSLLETGTRRFDEIDNPFLCHGLAGASLIYHSALCLTTDTGLVSAAGSLTEKLIDACASRMDAQDSTSNVLLEGYLGVALTMFSLSWDGDSLWERFILLK